MGKKKQSIKNLRPQGNGYSEWVKMGLIALAATIFTIGGIKFSTRFNASSQRLAKGIPVNTWIKSPVRVKIDELDRYFVSKHTNQPPRYWITGNEPVSERIDKIMDWAEKARKGLGQYRYTDPLTGKIHEHFGNFSLSLFSAGKCIQVERDYPGETSEQTLERIKDIHNRLEVCIVPQVEMQRYRFPSAFYYHIEWRTILVLGVEIPEGFLAALLYHELGHAYKHQVELALSATALSRSDLWVEEEVEMHTLEHRILNTVSVGALDQLYFGIFHRVSSPSLETVFATLQKEDVEVFERLFEVKHASMEIAEIYAAQFFMGLGLYVIDQTYPMNERIHRKVAFYGLIAQ